jgi:hypothetical protein
LALPSIISGAPEDLTGGRPNARAAAMTCQLIATIPLLATAWVAEPYVLASWAFAMPPCAVALRGDLTQAELKTAWNAGQNDAARCHRGGIEIERETKR